MVAFYIVDGQMNCLLVEWQPFIYHMEGTRIWWGWSADWVYCMLKAPKDTGKRNQAAACFEMNLTGM